jgi:hypothetical protein
MDDENGAPDKPAQRFFHIELGPDNTPMLSHEGVGWMDAWAVAHLLQLWGEQRFGAAQLQLAQAMAEAEAVKPKIEQVHGRLAQ